MINRLEGNLADSIDEYQQVVDDRFETEVQKFSEKLELLISNRIGVVEQKADQLFSVYSTDLKESNSRISDLSDQNEDLKTQYDSVTIERDEFKIWFGLLEKLVEYEERYGFESRDDMRVFYKMRVSHLHEISHEDFFNYAKEISLISKDVNFEKTDFAVWDEQMAYIIENVKKRISSGEIPDEPGRISFSEYKKPNDLTKYSGWGYKYDSLAQLEEFMSHRVSLIYNR